MDWLMAERFSEPLGTPRASVQVDTKGCDHGWVGCWRRGDHSCWAPSRIWSLREGRRFVPSRSVNQRGEYPDWALTLARTKLAHFLRLPERSVSLLVWRCAADSRARVVRQILLMDGPSVLGMDEWRRLQEPSTLGLLRHALGYLLAAGRLPAERIEPLAHLLFGAMTQAALALGTSIDPDHARRVYRESLELLLDGLERG